MWYNHATTYLIDSYIRYRKFGLFPEPGGLRDQCPYLMDDFATLDWLVAFELAKITKPRSSKPGFRELK